MHRDGINHGSVETGKWWGVVRVQGWGANRCVSVNCWLAIPSAPSVAVSKNDSGD